MDGGFESTNCERRMPWSIIELTMRGPIALPQTSTYVPGQAKCISSLEFLRCTIFVALQNSSMSGSHPSVLVIDTNPARAAIIEAGLRSDGFTSVHVITEVDGLAARIEVIAPDAIVMDLGNPNRDMLENMLQVTRAVKKPVAMFVDQSDNESMQQAIEAGVSADVVDGFRQDRIKSIMEMAISRFNAFSRLERELETAKSALNERTTIDKAKRLLMKSRGLDEDAAYQLLRKTAMNQNRRIVEVAESLLMSASLLGGDD